MLGMSEELQVAASVLIRERELAHKRGYAEGLEAAANTVERNYSNGALNVVSGMLRDEAKRVREMGVPTEVAK